MGLYDLVISTKPFHPACWRHTYGYRNRCVCVPHGYDPDVHYWPDPPGVQDIDVVLLASWRPQYESLMMSLGRLMPDAGVSVALGGQGWEDRRGGFPAHWRFPGPLYGRSYGEFVRRARIVIAPVHADVLIDGLRQPGDEDTTRTYELAAAGAFFLHRRTPYATQIYREGQEVGFWSDAAELAAGIKHYLPLENVRRRMAAAAHLKAVPAFSISSRAREVLEHVRVLVEGG